MSKHHATIMMNQDNQIELVDLNSLNKTFVNDKPMEANVPFILHSGDHVKFGKSKITSRAFCSHIEI